MKLKAMRLLLVPATLMVPSIATSTPVVKAAPIATPAPKVTATPTQVPSIATSTPKESVENNKPAHSELNDSDHDKADDTGTLGTKNKTDSSYSEDNSQNMSKNDEKEISSEHQKNSGQQLENWRELYNLPYSLSCMDERLGVSTTREFQTGLRSPTTQEMTSLETCDLAYSSSSSNQSVSSKDAPDDKRPNQEEADDMNVLDRIELIKSTQGGWIRTGDPKNDQFTLGYIPTPDEWRCGVSAVGVKVLRDIKAGKHVITDEETRMLEPCFRASPDSLIHPLAQVWEGHCIPLDIFLEFLDYYRPSWEQLECHFDGIQRYDMPEQVRYLQNEEPFGIRNNKAQMFPAFWDRIMSDPYYQDLKLNFSPSMANVAMPPSYDEEYNSINCNHSFTDENGKLQLDADGMDEVLRGATVGFLIEKKKGRRIYADTDSCSNAYIVQGDIEDYKGKPINDIDDYEELVNNILIPKFVLQAKVAEKVKAEMMQIGGIRAEVEVIFGDHPFLWNLPPAEQIELAQWTVDKLIPEVRRHFDGLLWIISAANYDAGHPDFPLAGQASNLSFGPHWKNLSLGAADHVSFTFTLSCDYKHAERYIDVQFEAIREMIQRDNITSFSMFTGTPRYKFGPDFNEQCEDDWAQRELDMHKLFANKLDSLPIRPYFLPIPPRAPRDWTRDEEGYSPTVSDGARGNWQLYSVDENEWTAEVQEFWMEYAKSNVRD
jgi:hypothetical protein